MRFVISHRLEVIVKGCKLWIDRRKKTGKPWSFISANVSGKAHGIRSFKIQNQDTQIDTYQTKWDY